MSNGQDAGKVHSEVTRSRRRQYLFHVKHHGQGGRNASQWLPALTEAEEFNVFDDGDFFDFANEHGSLYGIRHPVNGTILPLGTWKQQVAFFPVVREGEPWHGYPLYPIAENGPDRGMGQQQLPPKEVLRKIANVMALTRSQCKRLSKGDFA